MSTPSESIPPELLDLIVDLLYDTGDALRECCLVSKSWIPRTRKHIFVDIGFYTLESLRSWEETFPNPSTSPACYTKTLSIGCYEVVDAGAGGWMRAFSRVVRPKVWIYQSASSLLPFHGFSPAIKSLSLRFPIAASARIFNFILSFPLLEDLSAVIYCGAWTDKDNGPPTVAQASSLPMTGSLELIQQEATRLVGHRLLSIPGGIHFRQLNLTLSCEGDLSSATALVESCSHNLESLDITCDYLGMSIRHLHPNRRLISAPSQVGVRGFG